MLATPGRLRRSIRSLRRRRGWQQANLAAAVGRSQQWVSAIESGRSDPSLGDVMATLRALGVSVAVRPASTRSGTERSGAADG